VAHAITTAAQRLPAEHWHRTWLIAAVVATVVVGGDELYWRFRGVQPGVESRESVWTVTRSRLKPTSTVAVGTSRMMASLDPDVWARTTGGTPALHLSVLGGSTIRALEYLAGIPEYRGLVIADLVPYYTFDASPKPQANFDRMADAYRRAKISPAQRIEAYLRTYVPSHFAFRRFQIQPRAVWAALLRGQAVELPTTVLHPNGFAPIDFRMGAPRKSHGDDDARQHLSAGVIVPTAAELATMERRLVAAVEQIQRRGGNVALVFSPGCGVRRTVEEEMFPKDIYWTAVRTETRAYPIDLDDYPGFRHRDCHDGSHIDVRESAALTRWIAEQIKAAGLLPP
jgi:hypothetical protein